MFTVRVEYKKDTVTHTVDKNEDDSTDVSILIEEIYDNGFDDRQYTVSPDEIQTVTIYKTPLEDLR